MGREFIVVGWILEYNIIMIWKVNLTYLYYHYESLPYSYVTCRQPENQLVVANIYIFDKYQVYINYNIYNVQEIFMMIKYYQ